MFAQAGFSEHYTIVCAAFIRRHGRRWVRPAYLVRWASGDYAWGGERGVSWPEQIHITSLIECPGYSIDYARSRLPA